MAWIYLAGSEASLRHFDHGSRQSHIAITTDTLKLCYCKKSLMEKYLTPPSGTTSVHSGERCFQILTSSTVDSPVRTSALQELEKAWQVSAVDYSMKSCASWKKYIPHLSFSKMFPPYELEDWLKSSGHFPIFGMTVAGRVYLPMKLEPHTLGKDGFCLPTPTAHQYGSSNNGNPGDSRTQYKTKGKMSLQTMAKKNQWPMLPTPRPCSGLRSSGANRTEIMNALKLWPTPRASEATRGPGGGSNRKDHQKTLSQTIGGQLNPTWVEWLMGYPIGWTALDHWATQWFRSKRVKHL